MSKFGIWAALGLVAAAGIAIGGAEALTAARKVDAPAPVDIQDRSLVQAGAYIARTGDCVACHSVPGGKPFAGGLAMQTPVGTIYSSNITPDRKTGIGAYSYADFKNAVQHGIRKDGTPLYPPCPIRPTPSCRTRTCARCTPISWPAWRRSSSPARIRPSPGR